MKIAGTVAISDFPMFDKTIQQLAEICDGVFVRFDAANGDPSIMQAVKDMLGDKMEKLIICNGWKHPDWREDCLRMVDDYAPDIVICPDQDEVFCDGIVDELKAFYHSEKQGMMFSYNPLKTCDFRVVNNNVPYPPIPHMKAYRWKAGLSYYPYHGNAIISSYCNTKDHWQSKVKIDHYCCWTEKMERSKHWKSNTPNFKGVKGVTLVGFGPSAKQNMEAVGEVWSLNNCYEVLRPEAMQRCTRIYDMHKFGPRNYGWWLKVAEYQGVKELIDRNKLKSGDGRLHVDRLNTASKKRRIILQEPHPKIANSESYPIEDVVNRTGLDWFMGTPAYMVAQAIYEEYTHIRVYGLDQLDWEHTLQRECFAGWMCYALGRGIQISGSLTWLHGIDKRYGYDFGPEFDQWCQDLLWRGHPFSLKYKIESRVVKGDLCRAIGG